MIGRKDIATTAATAVTVELEALSESGFALAIQLLGRHADAADVVQDSLRKLVHSGQYDAEAVDALADAAPAPDEAAARGEMNRLVRRELEALPEEQREIILLRDFHDLSYAEIAEVLDLAPGTVMSRLHRARQALRDRMKTFLP